MTAPGVVAPRTLGVVAIALPGVGEQTTLLLDPPTVAVTEPGTPELCLVAVDSAGNAVHRIATAEHPRTIALAYEEPVPLYARWWLWAIVGGVVAAATSTTVYLATQKPPERIGGTVAYQK